MLQDNGSPFVLIDVREPVEHAGRSIPNSQLIPLNELPLQVATLNPTQTTVIYCESGVRSVWAGNWLETKGFKDVKNLTGGIVRWAEETQKSERT